MDMEIYEKWTLDMVKNGHRILKN